MSIDAVTSVTWRPPPRSAPSRAARARRLTSKECNLTPNASAASWSRGRRSLSSDSISGVMNPGSSAAIAAATTDATGVRLKPRRSAGRCDEHHVGDPLDQLLVGHRLRPGDVPRAAGERGGRVGGADEEGEHVAAVDRLRAVHAPGRQGEHGQALDQAHEEAERARAGADHDRGAQRDRLVGGLEQRLLDGEAGGEVAGSAARPAARARRGRRRAARRPRARRWRSARRRAARARGIRCWPVPPSSGSGSRPRRRRRARGRARRRSPRRRSRGRRAATPAARDPLGRAGEAAHVVAGVLEPRHERGADVAGHAGDQDPHRVSRCPGGGRKNTEGAESARRRYGLFHRFGGYLRGRHEVRAFCGDAALVALPRSAFLWSSCDGPVKLVAADGLRMKRGFWGMDTRGNGRKVTCDDCFFRRNGLCALAARQAVRDLPPGFAPGPAPAAADAVRVPAGAPPPGDLAVPHG